MSNIEEDIEILEEFIKLDRNIRDNKKESDYEKFCERRCIALENVLAERKQDKERIKELEAKLEFKKWGDLDNTQFEEYMRQFISKQKVKDVVKEAIEIIESEQFKVIMGDMTKVGRLRYLLEKTLLEDK